MLVVAGVLGSLGWLWRSGVRDEAISFLPRRAPGEWIVYPAAGDAASHPRLELATEFKRSFALDKAPPEAVLRVAGFRRFSISINGARLGEPLRSGST